MQPALRLLGPRPASRPAVLTGGGAWHWSRAVGAPDAGIAALVELVIGHAVTLHVFPDSAPVPVGQRADLEDLILPVPAHQRGIDSGAALSPGDGRDPHIGPDQRLLERLDPAELAAPIGIPAPELGTVPSLLACRCQRRAPVDERDRRIPAHHPVAQRVGFGKEEPGIDVHDGDGCALPGIHVDERAPLHSEGGGDHHSAVTKALDRPSDELLGGGAIVDVHVCLLPGAQQHKGPRIPSAGLASVHAPVCLARRYLSGGSPYRRTYTGRRTGRRAGG
jgi:hypothetical protein